MNKVPYAAYQRMQNVAEDPRAPEVALEASNALALLLFLDAFLVDVRAWIVGGGVRRGAIGDRLDERRPVSRPRARHRLASRLVTGEHIRAVDAEAGHPVPHGPQVNGRLLTPAGGKGGGALARRQWHAREMMMRTRW